ncbi:hemagglutinin repeat-containing protein [Xanthomonas translucens]|uniref:hemagglutinin repeat-containing protein n=2 Tax=Xanthomonas campestris pv. translucens TaxID=343 RepID=UPI000B0502F3|nr:hemagglutinin repeat-containing protein [Xanthomonas translucens]MCT8280617.1 hemagglutinin repeat-containing protein [Xanthomonas translucens pv. undulosa]MCT8315429.1 hemagglutinin repeat-containing protein [Xanthomonas translucens pv. undulosa]WLA15974.1 hemagglutinin repeat-containing protein [Xanthomonas translucens]
MDKDSAGMGTTMAERCKRALAMLLCCTVTWTSLPLYAQVVPVANPGGQQPGQQAAANGVPVVDIVAPNARGVSHNRYSRFDVGSNGLILNNSGNISKTELGGYIAGNDNLKNSGAATLILNEVTSSASRLQGYTEIAGARAQLVIANPNGISCDGCGFLNASRVTLATGTPQLGSDGALNGFGITGGALSIGSNGLDAYNVDRLDLLSRQLSVGGSVWAKDLLASTGTQRIGYDGMLLELLPGSDGAAPSIGIDVAYLGGMYADRIRLIATEAGVGVVSRGTLAAQSGSLQIDSAGQLSLSGNTVARDDVDLRAAGALTQQGTLGSQQAGIRLRAAQVSLSGDTVASGLLDARASGSIDHRGRSSAGAISLFGSELDAGGTLYSSGTLRLDASGSLRSSGVAYAGGAVALRAGGSWLQNAGTLQSGGAMNVQAARIDAAGTLDAGTGLGLRSDGDMRLSGLVQSWQDAALQAGGRLDNAGQLSAGGRVDITAAAIGNGARAVLSASGDLALATTGTLDNAGTVYAGRDLRIDAAAFANAGSSYAGRNADIASSGAIRSGGSLVAGDALRVDAAQFASSGELGSQRGATSLRSRGDLMLDGAVAAKGALTAQAAGDLHQSGTLNATSAQLQAGGAALLDGTLKTDGALQLSADGQLRSTATIVAGGDADLHAQGALLQAGQVQAGGALRLQGADIDQSGVLDAGTTLSLRSGNGMRLAGTLQARGDVSLDSAAALQNQAQVVAGGNLAVAAGSLDNASGAALSASGDATIASVSALRNAGSVYADGALRLRAGSFDQTETGKAYGGASLDLAATDAVDNRGDLVGGGDVHIAAGSIASGGQLGSQRGELALDSRGDLTLDGVVVAAGALRAAALGDLQQRGSLQAQSAQLQAGRDLTLAGTLRSATTLQLQAQRALRVDGQAVAGGDLGMRGASVALGQDAVVQTATALQLDAGTLDSRGALDAGTDLSLRSSGAIALSGIAQGGRDVALQADQSLDNQARVFAGRTLTLSAASATNRAQGELSAQAALDADVQGALDNAGTLQAGQALSLSAGSLQQSGRAYAGDTLSVQVAGALDNRGDLIARHDVRVAAGSVASSGQLGSQEGQLLVDSRGDVLLDGSQIAATALRVQAVGDLQQRGTSKAQSLQLSAGRDLSVAGSLQSAANLQLQAQRALNLDGQAVAGGAAQLSAASIATGSNAVLQSTAAITLDGASIDSRGALDAGTDLSLRSQGQLTLAGIAQGGRDVVLEAGAALDNSAQVVAGRDLQVSAASAVNRASGTLAAADTLNLRVAGLLDNAGRLRGQTSLLLQAGSLQHSGELYAGQTLDLHSAGALDNRGTLIAGGDLRIDAGSLGNSGQIGSETGKVTLSSQGDIQLGGSVIAAQALSASALGDLQVEGALKAQSATFAAGRDLSVAGGAQTAAALELQAQRALRVDGQVLAGGDLRLSGASIATGTAAVLQGAAAVTLQGGAIDSRGTLAAGTDLTLRSDGALAVAGVAQAKRDMALDAGAALSNAGQVVAGRDLSVAAHSIDNAASGTLAAQGALQLATPGTLSNAGNLQAGQAMTLDAGTLHHSGQAYAGDRLTLRASGAVDNQGELIARHDLQVDAASIASSGQLGSETGQVALTSQGDLRLGGTVAAATQLQAQAQGDLLQSGSLSAQALDLHARDITLAGQVTAAQALQVQAQRDLRLDGQASGQAASLSAGATLSTGSQAVLHSAGALALTGARIDSQCALDAGTTLALTSSGDLALAGIVQAATTLKLSAGGALSNAAQVVAGTDLTLTAASVYNAANSLLAAQGDATLTVSGALDNAGALRARQRLQLDVGSLQQTGRSYGLQRLGLTASGAVDNRGDLIAGSALRVEAASVASSGQLGSESGDVALVSHGDLALGGTLAAAGAFSAQAGGALSQSGTLSAATTLQLQAHGDLTVAGSLSANQLTLTSDAALLQRGIVNGSNIALQAQRIDNAGQTLSSGNLSLHAGDIAIGGVAAAGVRSDGSLGSSGALDLRADRTLSASGKLIAAGNLTAQATQLNLAGSTTRVGGDASLTASNGLDHRGADLLAGGLLTVRAGGSFDNSTLNGVGGQLQAARLDLGAASLRNTGGTLVQSGSGQTRIAITGAFDNGKLATNGQDLTLSAASLNNAQGRIEHAGTGTATLSIGGTVANAGGRILSQGQLQLGANAGIDNQNGAIAAAGDATLTAASLSNVGGSVSARGVNAQLGGALDNRSGVLQAAGGTLTVRADSLDNRSGTLQAVANGGSGGDLRADIAHTLNNDGGLLGASNDATVGAENLSNSAGTIQAGRDLALTARGQLDNHQSGRIGSGRDLTVAVTGALLNSGGQLDSGNAMTVSGSRIDNSQGSIANNGGGLTQLSTGGELRNAGGSLGGRGRVVLNAASVVNSDGQLVAGGDLVANSNSFDNQRGNVYAGNTFQLQRAGATLDNRSGTIKAEQAVRLSLQSLSNSGGRIGAGSSAGGAGDVVIDTVGFDGGGNILAQNLLDLTVRSDYTHNAGADITSNGDFRLNVGGNLVNASALKAARSLSVTANNISNRAGATMQAANTQLTTGGTIDNAGDISASNNLQLTAGSIYNTGSLVGGNVLVDTGTLVNGADLGSATDNAAYGSALIGATNGMTLLVRDKLLNRDAKIFSLGNIAIGGARDGSGTITSRTGVVNNLSGSIEADGSISIAANQLNNQRRVLSTKTGPLSDAERAEANAGMPSELIEGRGITYPNVAYYIRVPYKGKSPGVYREYSVAERESLMAASAEGRIAAGGNIALSGSVTNNASTIAAAGGLWINQRGVAGLSDAMINNGEVVSNQALALNQKVIQHDVEHKVIAYIDDCAATTVSGLNARKKPICGYENETNILSSTTVDSSYIALAANMTGGQGVSINGATINNGAVGSDGRSISGAAFNARQGTALSRRSAQSASGVGNKAVQAQTGKAAGGATVNNRIVSASIGPIRIDDEQGALVKSTETSAVDVHTQGVQAALTGSGDATRSQVQAGGAQAVLAGSNVAGQRQQIDPGTGTVPQVVGGIGAPLGNITLPIGGLYRLVGANGASVNALGRASNGLGGVNANRSAGPGRRYLIETDPRFVNYDTFISSDYLLDKLGVDPQWTQTRLGDGFYEQRLVLDQITQLTGRRYLGNYADGVAQYRALLDGGVAEAGALHLDVGVALTAGQVAALTHDIVWMVEQEVQGQKVLVPVVYLSSSTALTLRSDGALIASDNGDVSLNATAGLSNRGTISGVNVSATAGTLLNQGRIAGTGTVALQAKHDLLNRGGQIIGRDVLLSAGNDLRSTTRDAVAGGAIRSGISADNTLLMNTGHDLTLTGTAVQAGGSAALQAGNNLVLQPTALRTESGLTRGGDATSLTVGQDLSLLAGNDLQLHGVAITAGGDAALQAGHDLSLTPVTDANGKATVRTSIVTDGSLQLAAGHDVTIRQAEVKAGGDLIAAAGHDLNVTSVLGESTTTTDHSRQGKTKVTTTTTTQDIDQQALSAGGNLILSAGNDVNLVAAKLDAGKGLAVVAGHDLNSTTLTTVDSSDTLETRKRFKQTTSTRDETVHSTDFTAGSDIALQAGHDVNLTAAKVYTDTGSVSVAAGHDVNLLAAQEQHDAEQDMQKKKKGFLSSKTTTTHDEWHDNTAVVTTLSGDSVQIAAGNNLLSQGAQVAGTGDVVLAAGNNLTLETVQNAHSEEHDKQVKKTGLYSGGGFSVTLGASKKTDTLDATEITNSGSLVGSTDGAVTMTAGNAVSITGSDVLSKTGTAIVGKEVTIAAAENRVDTVQTSKQQSAGISLGLTGGLVDAVQTAYGAVKRGSEVEDDRLKALYAVKAGYSISDAAGLASNGLKGYNGEAVAGNTTKTGTASADGAHGAANATGVSLRIGIGASSSSSKTTTHEETTGSSRILSDGNVTIAATGGDLNVIGSKIAGNNVALAAANNLNLLSQQENNTTKSENKNAGGEIGFSVGATTGYYLTVSAGKGSAKGNSDLHTESVVTANGTLTLASGNHTTIKGAQAVGDKVLAKVGGNLLIQSEQDENDYKSKQQQASVTLATGSGSGGSYSQQKVNSNYTSVAEQSGIQAGNGGFDVTVGGNTHLIGGAIASTADALRNHLSTDSLTVEDLKNESDYKSSGVSVAGGSGSSMVSVAAGTALSMLGNSSGNSSSTTKSDIAAGTVDVRNGDQTALAGLDRTASELQQSGLKDIFDQKKLAEQKELAAVAGEVGFRVAGDVASVMQRKAQADVLNAPDEETRKEAQSRLEAWSDGGTNKVLLHGLTGAAIAALGGESALQGMAAAAGAEAAKGAMSDYLVAHGITDKETYNALMELGSAAIGGLLGGQAGATTALSGDQFNRQLHPDEVTWIRQNAPSFALQEGISEEEATRRLTVEAAARVDAVINGLIGNTNVDESAQKFLSTNTNQYAWGRAFQATDAEYNDFHLYGKDLASSSDNFLAVYNSLYQSGVRKDTLQSDYSAELLTFAGTQIGSSGRGVLAVPATGIVLGGGVAVVVVATPIVITACLSNPVACNGVGIGAIDIVAGDAMGGHSLSGAAEKKAAQVIEEVTEKTALKTAATSSSGRFKVGIKANEIESINASFGGSTSFREIDTVLANSSNYDGFYNKTGSIIRDIAGGHLFDNGNKRTAVEVTEQLIARNGVDGPPKEIIWSVVDRVATGELTKVEDIAKALRGLK